MVSHLPWSDQSATDCPALLRLRAEDLGGEAATSGGVDRQQNITATDDDHQGALSQSDYDTTDPLVSVDFFLFSLSFI